MLKITPLPRQDMVARVSMMCYIGIHLACYVFNKALFCKAMQTDTSLMPCGHRVWFYFVLYVLIQTEKGSFSHGLG